MARSKIIASSTPTSRSGSANEARTGDTPMMAQYFEIKRKHEDCLLFYRMGDFYELFMEDAVTAARILDITLTRRGTKGGEDIPMCGVPWHSHRNYLAKLIQAGHKVALCEQMESPEEARQKRGSKALVTRKVVRVVTQGSLTEEELLDARSHNYIVAIAAPDFQLENALTSKKSGKVEYDCGMAWMDLSTGDFYVQETSFKNLGGALSRLNPEEVLISESLSRFDALSDVFESWKTRCTIEPDGRFSVPAGERRLKEHYDIKSLDAFGGFGRLTCSAAGGLLDYISRTQMQALPHIRIPEIVRQDAHMTIDAATRRSLELTRSVSGQKKGSLLHTIDRTITGGGGRLLGDWLAAPLTNLEQITFRQDGVAWLLEKVELRNQVRSTLKGASDLERAAARIAMGRGGPPDLIAIRDAIQAAESLAHMCKPEDPPPLLLNGMTDLTAHYELADKIGRAIHPNPPSFAREGDFIARGFAPELDALRELRDESTRMIAALQAKYAHETATPSLKIKHNNVLGYFIEVPASHGDKLMSHNGETVFQHRQTNKGAVRFITDKLSTLESKILSAREQTLAVELNLFESLSDDIRLSLPALSKTARTLAQIDVCAGLGELAAREGWCRPICDDSFAFEITAGRHPVVEMVQRQSGDKDFIANDCNLCVVSKEALVSEHSIERGALWLLTGPNMAGKSTFLRQNALIAILAQAGSFVPAAVAHIGIVDQLFSRVGASDDLAHGRSTFMVEMIEAAAILNQASSRALVILDEIGRGTSTYDGVSIAWAVLEHLHDSCRCRGLFATHYHELVALEAQLPHVSCHTMRVREWKGEVVFLHEVAPGASDRSYGVHVARLAGLPEPVIRRAHILLARFEAGGNHLDTLPLFETPDDPTVVGLDTQHMNLETVDENQSEAQDTLNMLLAALDDLNPDSLSPRDAHARLYDLFELRQHITK